MQALNTDISNLCYEMYTLYELYEVMHNSVYVIQNVRFIYKQKLLKFLRFIKWKIIMN